MSEDGRRVGIRVLRTALLVVAIMVPATAAPPPAFKDPKPPSVRPVPKRPAATARAYDRVTFHAAPKPLARGAITHDWPCFMGPSHNGVSTETPLLKTWPKDGPTLIWELETGDSYSSPAIAGRYLVYPHRVGDQVLVECLDPETGKAYWQYSFATAYRDRFGYSNGPRASPVIDGDRVYIHSAEGQLVCLKLSTGQVHWKRNLPAEFKALQDFFGSVATPLLEGDKLIVNLGAPGGPCVAAFDKLTGRLAWGAGRRWGPGYASPVPATLHGRRRVFVFLGGESDPPTGGLMMIDPASGKVEFEFPWRSPKFESVNASCPVVVGNRVFISASYRAGSTLLEIGADGSRRQVWTIADNEHNTRPDQLGLHWNTPVEQDGYLYAFDGRNEPDASMVCVDLKTGKVVWRETPEWTQVVTVNGRVQKITLSTLRGSFLKVDGRFLCLAELGQLMWMDLNPKGYKILQRAPLFLARETWAMPVLSRGLVYISQNTRDPVTGKPPRLLCYDLRGAAAK